MSVTAITEKEPPRLSDTLTGGATATRVLQAICDSKNDGPITIQAHASCPVKGSTYNYGSESSASLVCTGVSIDPVPGDDAYPFTKVWTIAATYSNSVDTASVGEDEEDPLDDPPSYEFSFAKYQVPALSDVDGNAVVTGADEEFDPPFLIDENRPIVTVTRNELSFSPSTAVEYQDAVNSDAFAGVDPGVAKMVGISARSATRGSVDYWVVTYEIEFRWDGWNPTGILAQGFKYRPAVGEQSQNYIDPATKQAPSSPILLNLDGTKADDPLGDGAVPVFHEFTFYREKTFGLLNLGL